MKKLVIYLLVISIFSLFSCSPDTADVENSTKTDISEVDTFSPLPDLKRRLR